MLLRAAVLFGLTFAAAAVLGLRVPTVLGLAVAFLSLYPCVGLLVGGVLFAVAGALRWPDLFGPVSWWRSGSRPPTWSTCSGPSSSDRWRCAPSC